MNIISQIDACDLAGSEEDAELAVCGEGPNGQEFAPVMFVVPPFIAEGVTLLAGKATDK